MMLDKNQVLERLAAAPDEWTAVLHGAEIGDVDFRNHSFDRPAVFAGARFAGNADFSRATFKKSAAFGSCVFDQPASFRNCTFERGAYFSNASFRGVDFFMGTFCGTAHFWRARFRGKADFSQVKVRRAEWLPASHDGQANFSWARFDDSAVFTYAEFEWPVYLHRTVFKGDVYLDQCIFHGNVTLYGKRTDVLVPRFGLVDPERMRRLEQAGLFTPDTEAYREYRNERVSEFVCFTGILSREDLARRLCQAADLPEDDKVAILTEWQEGAQRMFADSHLVTFRGARFNDLERLFVKYVDLDRVVLDRDVAGTAKERKKFEARLKQDSFDIFISHASEDKAAIARPLSEKLQEMGLLVWLDENEIEIGEELLASLNNGMTQSRFGLMIISKAFIEKKWTQFEVKQLLKMSKQTGKRLFFIWHGVNEEQVSAWSPELAKRVALASDRYSLDQLGLRLAEAMR
jgi:uncharacterized protein YjbI with pentapeptide repeats